MNCIHELVLNAAAPRPRPAPTEREIAITTTTASACPWWICLGKDYFVLFQVGLLRPRRGLGLRRFLQLRALIPKCEYLNQICRMFVVRAVNSSAIGR